MSIICDDSRIFSLKIAFADQMDQMDQMDQLCRIISTYNQDYCSSGDYAAKHALETSLNNESMRLVAKPSIFCCKIELKPDVVAVDLGIGSHFRQYIYISRHTAQGCSRLQKQPVS